MNTIVTWGIVPEAGEALTITIPMAKPEKKTLEIAHNFGALVRMFDGKQKDYGSNNISKFGEMGLIVRMNDKWERILNLTENGSVKHQDMVTAHESLADSMDDLAVYSQIWRMVVEGQWEPYERLIPNG